MTTYYHDHADELFAAYHRLDASDVHRCWLERVRLGDGLALDVGAGSGRDAAYLASRGHEVVAVEPAAALLAKARRAHPSPRIQWVEDSLPDLTKVQAMDTRFDLILVSAVWMHVAPTERPRAMRTLADLLAAGGNLVFTIREQSDPDRNMWPTSAAEEIDLFRAHGLEVVCGGAGEPDILGRADVTWRYWVLAKNA